MIAGVGRKGADPASLLEHIYELNKRDDQAGIIDLVEAEWPALRTRSATNLEAEICRQTMLACYKRGRYYDGYVWRMRAMIRAAAAGWLHGAAMLLQTEALRVQAQENGDRQPSDPEYVVVPQALEILEEMRPLAGDEGPVGIPQPSPQLVGRTYFEKRAFLLLCARRYSEAREAYESALRYVADDERGRLKVRGGLASCHYLSTEDPERRQSAIQETTDVADECKHLGQQEIGRIASANVAKMQAGRTDLLPYEVL